MLNLDFHFSSGEFLAYKGSLLAFLVKRVTATVINLFQKFYKTQRTLLLPCNGSGGGILWTHTEKQHCQNWEEGKRWKTQGQEEGLESSEDECEQNRASVDQVSIYNTD